MFYGYTAAYFSPNAFDAAYNDFEARVREDGGTDYAPTHTVDVINDVRQEELFNANDLLLLVGCSAGKAGTLYSIYAFQDYNAWITRVSEANVASNTHTLDEVTQGFQQSGFYVSASLLQPCAAGNTNILFSIKPTN